MDPVRVALVDLQDEPAPAFRREFQSDKTRLCVKADHPASPLLAFSETASDYFHQNLSVGLKLLSIDFVFFCGRGW